MFFCTISLPIHLHAERYKLYVLYCNLKTIRDYLFIHSCLFQWRVILSAVKKKSERVPVFSHEKHYILSSELKHLYVAVTRARRNIWICDENTEYSLPIRVYWERCEEDREEDQEEDRVDQEEEVREEEDWEEYREEDRKKDQRLFRVKTISNLGQAKTFFSNLAKKSSPDEWDQKGRDYFEKQQYEQVNHFLSYSIQFYYI